MVNYDFNKKLEKTEFENLVRDIIQIREGITFESFSVGPDDGIDFRKKDKDNSIIVQVKNVKKINDLYNILKNIEVKKVKALNPGRYILVTSIDLTPPNKERIKEIFKGFNIADDDIIGGRDLNNYLGMEKYQYIETNYPNLWYDSGHVFFQN